MTWLQTSDYEPSKAEKIIVFGILHEQFHIVAFNTKLSKWTDVGSGLPVTFKMFCRLPFGCPQILPLAPKQMIEAYATQLETLAEFSLENSMAWANEKRPDDQRIAQHGHVQYLIGKSVAFEACASRLRELLKLKGWE